MQALQSALGVVAIIAIAFVISENRRAVPWRPVITGLALTFALALLMLKIPQTEIAFGWINRAVEAVAAATRAGTAFVFGYVGGGALPFDPKTPGSNFILAFQALPVVLMMSVLSSLLFYWRILPPIVRGFLMGAGAHARRRRRGRPLDRSQYLCRPGRGAAIHPAHRRAFDHVPR